MQAEHGVAAQAQVIKTADKMAESLLDVWA
jgi:hypothetical protein